LAVSLLLGQLLLATHAFDHLDPAESEETVCDICLLSAGVDQFLDPSGVAPIPDRPTANIARFVTDAKVSPFRCFRFARAPPGALSRYA